MKRMKREMGVDKYKREASTLFQEFSRSVFIHFHIISYVFVLFSGTKIKINHNLSLF